MASNSGWTFGLPSGQSKVSNTDEEFRSLKSYVEHWIEQEHYVTGGSSTSAGVHRLGSARVFLGTASQLSNPTGDNAGRLFWVTDTEELRVANPSTSSWSVVADAIKLDSVQTFTARQGFSGGLSLAGVFSAITSRSTTLVRDFGTAAGSSSFISIDNSDHRFAPGDFLIASYDSDPSTLPVLLETAIPSSFSGVVHVRFFAPISRSTFVEGTVVRVMGFKAV